jgi:hypothetical protein
MRIEKIDMEKENKEQYIFLANKGYKYCVIEKGYTFAEDGESRLYINYGGLYEKEMAKKYVDMGYIVVPIKKFKNKIGGNKNESSKKSKR